MADDNLLLKAASPLLNAMVQIRQAATHDDPAGLRQSLVEEIRLFENNCRQAGLPFETQIAARYALCCSLDEAAAQTPWGTRGVWSGSGMLATFHNESWGGEKFFHLLARLSQNPRQHIWLLELIHYCLLLGYLGRYRGSESGLQQCEIIRQRLAGLIETTRETEPKSSTVQVQVHPRAHTLRRPPVPLWACFTLAALLGCILYFSLNWQLGNRAEPLLRDIYQTPLPQINPLHQSHSPQSLLNLRRRLHDVVAAGQLQVSDGPFGSKIIIPADKLFSSDGTAINPIGRELLARVASAIEDVKGTILVSVYTDDNVLASSRFASSYEFSLARAQAITQLLARHRDEQLLKAEGRGDSTPLLPNDSNENRERNRRVEITLFAAPDTATLRQDLP